MHDRTSDVRQGRPITLALGLGVFLIPFDVTAVVVAMPGIARDLGFAVAGLPVGMALIRWARGWVHGRKPKPASNGVRPGKETQPQQKPARADGRRVNALFGASWFRALIVITALFALFVEASLLGLQAVADARAKAGR